MVFAALKVLLFGVARQEPRTQRSAVERTDQTVIGKLDILKTLLLFPPSVLLKH